MIEVFSETDFTLDHHPAVSSWIESVIISNEKELGDITYIFCDDEYLHKINLEFLNHDTFTDIITFDNSMGKQVHGEIYISIDRVRENAQEFTTEFSDELHRVIIHGVLHLCGLKDKSLEEEKTMRLEENKALSARSFV